MTSEEHPSLVLASASPRRRRLLRLLGVAYSCTSAEIDEDIEAGAAADPASVASAIASEKALAARAAGSGEGALILACDTIVVESGSVLGKPADIPDAYRMLETLSGHDHEVITACTLLPSGERSPATFAVTTRVTMRDLSRTDMAEWAEKGELLGCAGAYNIESHLASVGAMECFQNVAGLPLCHLYAALATDAFGRFGSLGSPLTACEAARGCECGLGRRLVAAMRPPDLRPLEPPG